MAGTKKDFTDHGYSQYSIGTLGVTQLFNVPTIGASVAPTTVQASFVTPSRIKIASIAISALAVSTVSGAIAFNIVVGAGAYETVAAVAAVGTFTLTGVPTTGDNNIYTIGGVVITNAQLTANTLSAQATSDAAAITAGSALVSATAAGATITVTALVAGLQGNNISTVGNSTGGDTVTANQTYLTGGNDASGVVTVQNDNRTLPYYNQAASSNQIQIAGGGSGITTNFALPGNALFAYDVAIDPENTPGILVGGGTAVFGDVPTLLGTQVLAASDAVFERGQLLTLRFITPAGASVTGFVVSALTEVRNLNEPSTPSELQPGQLNANGLPNNLGQFQSFTTPSSPNAIKIQNVRPVSGVTF
jgi:hypothetical protein